MMFPQPFSRSHRRLTPDRAAFTLIELLTVITVIVILVGLIVGAAGYANTKAARTRAEGEIKALSAAAENYKSDNGIYPRSADTDKVDPRVDVTPNKYNTASRDLYAMLSGQVNATSGAPITPVKYPPTPTAGMQNYWGDLKPSMLGGIKDGVSGTSGVTTINDPWGYSYGYSTIYQKELEDKGAKVPPDNTPPTKGYNPGFDLWSVANKPTAAGTTVWINNW